MFLPIQGDDGQFRPLHQQVSHSGFIPLAERNPPTIHDEMAVIAHPLGLLLADQGSQQLAALIVTEDASAADDVGIGTGYLVMVGKRRLDEFPARRWAESRAAAKPASLVCAAYFKPRCLIE